MLSIIRFILKISYDLIIDDKSIFHSNKWAQKINKYLKNVV